MVLPVQGDVEMMSWPQPTEAGRGVVQADVEMTFWPQVNGDSA